MRRKGNSIRHSGEHQSTILAVSAVILSGADQILLLQRSVDDDFLPEEWEVPGGEVKFGESPVGALLREVYEECGLRVDVGFPLFVATYFTDSSNKEQCFEVFYFCRMKEPDQEISLSPEHSSYMWMSLTRPPDVELTQSTRDLIESLANHPLINAT